MEKKVFSLLALLLIIATAAGSQMHDEFPFFWRVERTTATRQLEFRTEQGTCTLNLLMQQDGPVRIPLSSGRYSAVLVSTRLAANKVHVTLAGEDRALPEGGTVPLGKYEFSAEEPSLSWLPDEFRMMDVGLLNIKLVPLTKAACSGCGCGGLCCKPNAGACLECGSCGECCKEAT